MSIWAKLAIVLIAFFVGAGFGAKFHAGLVAQRDLQRAHEEAKERFRQREFAAPLAQAHAENLETLNRQLLTAHEEIQRLKARRCLDPRTVRVLNGTGNLPGRTPAAQPADPGPAAAPAGGDAAPDAGLRWASNIDVAAYIAYCRTEYAKVADRVNKILDIEDRRFGPPGSAGAAGQPVRP